MIAKKLPKVKFALLGYGHIGKKHASILFENENAELVAIADLNPFEKPAAPIATFTSLEELLNSNITFDVVIIATPNGLHKQHAVACLNRQKHVVIEKPIALTTAAAAEIFEVAKSNGKEVFVVFQNRFAPTSLWLKEVLEKQQLGKIYMVQFNCFWNRDERYYRSESWHGSKLLDGGTLFTQFSHFIDTLYWLFGDVKNVKSKLINYSNQNTVEFEDTGIVTFDMASGGQGSFQFTTAVWDKNLESTITVIGEKGTIKIGGQYMDTISYCHAENVAIPIPQEKPSNNHQHLLKDIICRLQFNQPAKIERTAVLAVIEIIERIYAAN